jgi:hypothetical protein
MTRSHALTAAFVFAAASSAHGQQPAPRIVGPSGPGAQPQVGTGPYQGATPAARGVNPFAAPVVLPTIPPGTRFAPRGAAPVVFAPPPAPGVPNNPAVFNPGMPPPFPLLIPPQGPVVNGVAFNPIFVSRRGVVSAYYVPPTAGRSPSFTSYPGEEVFTPAGPETGPALLPASGEYRFLPWIW